MEKIDIIAIDGPSGTGKSTIAKEIAKRLGYKYLDTGAMYRALTYYLLSNNIVLEENKIKNILEKVDIYFKDGKIYLNGKDVSKEIRTDIVTANVSLVSSFKIVREFLVKLQRKVAKNGKYVVEGRDIGTNVFKNAKYKFYLTATDEVRAKRRWLQDGKKDDIKEVLSKIRIRDKKDSSRKLNPLLKAEDAYEIDTSNLTMEEVIKLMIEKIKK